MRYIRCSHTDPSSSLDLHHTVVDIHRAPQAIYAIRLIHLTRQTNCHIREYYRFRRLANLEASLAEICGYGNLSFLLRLAYDH